MLGLRAQRITFGCPAGNIAGGLVDKLVYSVELLVK